MIKRLFARALMLALLVGVVTVGADSAPAAAAANPGDFDPGNIISDAAFYDGGAMSATQIQQFLNAKVPNCQSGYTCLKDYAQSTPTLPSNAYCSGYAGASNESAAQILAKVGASCHVSQKVLLVLLQKEQSLVTHTWPSTYRFDKATGFACPDSAPCDPTYGGFFYQVYYAARQFQRYAAEPTRYNYRAGQVNLVQYHPNLACGAKSIYIANKATAGLYNYTPYQPNSAALANLYGTGDACSSYGNRNFWRMYTDWFGLPSVGSSLVRTATNATVYLVSGDTKYPVPSMAVFAALAPLGQLGYVSDSYLAGFTTGPLAGGAYRSEAGSIFIVDRGYRLEFQSCDQLADFGYSCGATSYVQLTDAQVAAFQPGPVMTNLVGTTGGARFYVDAGVKHEILDDASQTSAGISGGITVLTDEALRPIPFSTPYVRSDVFASVRGTAKFALFANGGVYEVPAAVATSIGASTRSSGSLAAESVALAGPSLGAMTTTVLDAEGVVNVLSPATRFRILSGGATSLTPITLPAALLDTYALGGDLTEGSFLIGPGGGTIYVVMASDIRPIASWDALIALSPNGSVSYTTVDQSILDSMPRGPVALTAGTLARSPQDATVFLINGVSTRVAFSSFVFPYEAGFTKFGFTSQERLLAYPLEPTLMAFGFSCGADKYVAAGGSLHLVTPDVEASYVMTYVPLDRFTCATMNIGSPAGLFIRTPDGTIWYLEGMTKHPVSSMARLGELGATSWLNVHPWFANMYATGTLA